MAQNQHIIRFSGWGTIICTHPMTQRRRRAGAQTSGSIKVASARGRVWRHVFDQSQASGKTSPHLDRESRATCS